MASPTDGASPPPAFPQLHFEYWPSQIFWLLISLGVLFYVLTRFALPRIQSTLEERRDTISGDLDKAAEFNLAAEEAEEAYDAALKSARAEAQKIADKTKADIKAKLDVAIAEADQRIAAKTAESEKQLAAIRGEAAEKASEVAMAAATALMGRFSPKPVDAAAVQTAVATRLAGRFEG